jgi:ubiquinone/menaquinone biosynthesis C-methylase UbiE
MNHKHTQHGLLTNVFRKLHGMPVEAHAHSHDDLGTEGATIRWAFVYDILVKVLFGGRDRQFRESIIRLAQIQPGEKVLDVGCGTGKMAITARLNSPPTAEIVGIDASPEMIDRARQHAVKAGVQVDFRTGLVEAIDFPDNAMDVVLSNFMVHHLPDDLKVKAFAEIYRVLKPGGRLQISEFEPPRSGFSKMILSAVLGQGMMRIKTDEIPPLLEQAGFTSVKMGSAGHPLATLVTGMKGGS